jgi:hypothetical protein
VSDTQGFEGRIAIVAPSMGYGHLRAAHAVADALGLGVWRADQAPLADERERRFWERARRLYEWATRSSQLPWVGVPLDRALRRVTAIPPPGSLQGLEAPSWGARKLQRMIAGGFGKGLVDRLDPAPDLVLSTFYSCALALDAHSEVAVLCVVTDTDINRVWAPASGATSRITYLAPTRRVAERLLSYGVRPERIRRVAFPLPPELLGDQTLTVVKGSFEARIGRLEALRSPPDAVPPSAPLSVTLAVGGAGVQIRRGKQLLAGLEGQIRAGQIRLTLVAGTRAEVAATFARWRRTFDLPPDRVHIQGTEDFAAYYQQLNSLLAETDVLWTKPSELVFYAGLGIPVVLDDPVGAHEEANRDWLLAKGAALVRPAPSEVAGLLEQLIRDGSLIGMARRGLAGISRHGVFEIAETCRHLLTPA